jgi:hypothetical protein
MSIPDITIPGRFTPAQATSLVEIQQRIYFYGWCIDHRRFTDLDDLFLPESVIHYDTPGGTKGTWPEIRAWLEPALQIFRCTQHNMGNSMIVFDPEGGEDPNHATSTTYGYLAHFQELLDGEISVLRHSAIYRDRWARQDGLWRILERTLSNVGEDGPVHFADKVRMFKEPNPL